MCIRDSSESVGQTFDAVIVAVNESSPEKGTAMLRTLGVEAPVTGASDLPLGQDVRVRLDLADIDERRVRFSLVE